MNPSAWRKVGPVFQKNSAACGVGHCCFVTTPDGAADWLIYHAKTSRRRGWSDREVRGQPFTWTAEGLPLFDSPKPVEVAAELGVSVADLQASLARAQPILYAARSQRVPPLLDDKVLVAWNGLMWLNARVTAIA